MLKINNRNNNYINTLSMFHAHCFICISFRLTNMKFCAKLQLYLSQVNFYIVLAHQFFFIKINKCNFNISTYIFQFLEADLSLTRKSLLFFG